MQQDLQVVVCPDEAAGGTCQNGGGSLDGGDCAFWHQGDQDLQGMIAHRKGKREKQLDVSQQRLFVKGTCNDFLQDKCDRGPRCKFAHILPNDLDRGDKGEPVKGLLGDSGVWFWGYFASNTRRVGE